MVVDAPTAVRIGQIIADQPDAAGIIGNAAASYQHVREVIDQYQIGLGVQCCPSIMVGGLMLNSVDDSVTANRDGIGGIPIRGQPGVERHE